MIYASMLLWLVWGKFESFLDRCTYVGSLSCNDCMRILCILCLLSSCQLSFTTEKKKTVISFYSAASSPFGRLSEMHTATPCSCWM